MGDKWTDLKYLAYLHTIPSFFTKMPRFFAPAPMTLIQCYRCKRFLTLGEVMMLYAEGDDPEGEPTLPYCGECMPHTVISSLEDPAP